MAKPTDLVQGTVDLLILRTLALQPMHGWGFAQRIRQVSDEVLQVNQGALYPALHGLDSRQVLFAGCGRRKYLHLEQARWKRPSSAIGLVL